MLKMDKMQNILAKFDAITVHNIYDLINEIKSNFALERVSNGHELHYNYRSKKLFVTITIFNTIRIDTPEYLEENLISILIISMGKVLIYGFHYEDNLGYDDEVIIGKIGRLTCDIDEFNKIFFRYYDFKNSFSMIEEVNEKPIWVVSHLPVKSAR